MQATIYVTAAAFQTAHAIKDLTHHERLDLGDEVPDLVASPGYHMKNANKLKLVALPEELANVLDALDALDGTTEATTGVRIVEFVGSSATLENFGVRVVGCGESIVTMPANLRGCIFEGAPNLPDKYSEIVRYWSGDTMNVSTSGAAYFQCSLNEYMVDLGPDPVDAPVINDRLLSEGIVVAVCGLADRLVGVSSDAYVEIRFPIDPDMLGNEPDAFRSKGDYGRSSKGSDRVFLKVADILASPDPDHIYIDLLRNELIDYGYWY